MTQQKNTTLILAGVALMVLPLVGVALKMISAGWMMVILLMGGIIVLILGYALQIVVAVQGFLIKNAIFKSHAGKARAVVAAWVTSVSVALFGLFMPDGGDYQYGSTFQILLGVNRVADPTKLHDLTDGINDGLAMIFGVLWVGAFVWLFVEWIIALSRRSKQI